MAVPRNEASAPASSLDDDGLDLDLDVLEIDDAGELDQEEIFLRRIEEDVSEARARPTRPALAICPARAYGAALVRMLSDRDQTR